MPFPLFYTDGKVGIGVPNPDAELDVLGNVDISGSLTVAGAAVAGLSIGAFGSTPNTGGASIAAGVFTLQPADATNPGGVTAGVQTFGGAKTFASTIAASNLSGTNTGNVTLAAVGAVPNANGATLTGQALNLEPASATQPGVVTIGTQTFAGAKTFNGNVSVAADLSMSGGNVFFTRRVQTNGGNQTIEFKGDQTNGAAAIGFLFKQEIALTNATAKLAEWHSDNSGTVVNSLYASGKFGFPAAVAGTATLVAGTVTVATAAVGASSKIFLTCNTPGGTIGFLSAPVASIVAATSFVINSVVTDTSTVNWWIIN